MPLALLKALEAEGLLIPTRVGGQERYTEEDVAASRAGLRLLEWGIPLTDLLELARRHNEATEATAREAVEMFARHVREPLRSGVRPDALVAPDRADDGRAGDPAVDGLLQAYAELLPAVNTLVGHHFTRTLVRVALDHVEQEGSAEERTAVWDRIRAEGGPDRPVDATGSPADDGRRPAPTGTGHRPASPSRRRPGPARPTSRRAARRRRSCSRCSTPSPPATTWSTAP